jgi:molybdenum cofactor biosynthesis protein MoaC
MEYHKVFILRVMHTVTYKIRPRFYIELVTCVVICLMLTQVVDKTATSIQPLLLQSKTWRHIPLQLLPCHTSSPSNIRLFSTSPHNRRSYEGKAKPGQSPFEKRSPLQGEVSPAFEAKVTSSSQTEIAAPTLTHLTSYGAAHMVSISSKDITKRTAAARCSVHFSNPVAATLIRSNQAKKGDVLGVARLAGIMASKRTADLIPLCHPIAITHVSVDVDLIPGNESSVSSTKEDQALNSDAQQSIQWAGTGQGDAHHLSSDNSNPTLKDHSSKVAQHFPLMPEKTQTNGSVEINATVSCEGKTGVEMEALTAASVAALTVYDMCKAVDKGMRIEGLRVVRKEGGRSGTWVESESVS